MEMIGVMTEALRPKLNPKSQSTSQASGEASIFGGQGLLAQPLGSEILRSDYGGGRRNCSLSWLQHRQNDGLQ